MSVNHSASDVGIADAVYYLPGEPVDVVDWADGNGVKPSLVERLLANGCRYFYEGSDQSDLDLISGAIEQLKKRNGVCLSEVQYLLHASTQAFSIPAPPSSLLTAIVQRYRLKPKICFSIGHIACASVYSALAWAVQLLRSDRDARYAMVVTSDRVFGRAAHRIRQDAGIQSDGGSAVLLAKERLRCRLGPVTSKRFTKLHEGPSSAANRSLISRYTWLHTKRLFQEHAEALKVPLEKYGQILPINADRHYWSHIAHALKLPEESFFLENIRERGHACCSDFAVNLCDRGFQVLEGGEMVLSCGQSNVGAYAALTLIPVNPIA